MISLRRFGVGSSALLIAGLIAACSTTDLTTPIARGVGARFDKNKDYRNPCPVSARVVVDASGNAVLRVSADPFPEVTGNSIPFGTLSRVEVQVSNSTGLLLADNDLKVAPPDTFFSVSLTTLKAAVVATKKTAGTPAVLFDKSDNVSVIATLDRPGQAANHSTVYTAKDLAGPCTVTAQAEVLTPPDISVQLERVASGGSNFIAPDLGDAAPGSSQAFLLDVSSPAHSLPTDATCAATITLNGSSPIAPTWITSQQLHLLSATSATCEFSLASLAPGTYTITATATSPGDPATANNSVTGAMVVRPSGQTIDVLVRSLNVDLGDGATAPLGQVMAGQGANYVAAIGVASGVGNQTSTPVLCSVKVTNNRTGSSTTVDGTVTGTATTSQDAICRFSLTLPSNGNLDEVYTISVTAKPTAITDLNGSNDTFASQQTAIVRSDLTVSGITMSVDGVVQSSVASILQGKTGVYIATIHNNSPRQASADCVVTAGPPSGIQTTIIATPASVTVPANGDATCTFSFAYPTLIAENFTVTAANVLPIDANPDDNSFFFQTVSHSDHTFPSITQSNVTVSQKWLTNGSGIVTELQEQRASITRITLTFAATSGDLGNFKLSGAVTSDGRPVSNATWTVNHLAPGSVDAANCVIGVDPGYTAINNHTLTLKICAQEVAGQPGMQAIFVEYDSNLPATLTSPDPNTLFGSTMQFAVALDWTLFGTTVPDHADATLQFSLQQINTGVPNLFQSNATGDVAVIRNGG